VGHFLQHRTEICIETELFSMGLDGSGLRQLTHDPTASSSRPAWSPDGRAIAYVSRSKAKEAGEADIFLMDADGSNPRQLTKGGTAEINVDPSWSPDGTEIMFCSNRNGGNEVYVMNRDGGSVRQLTHGTRGRIFHPSWSPDGLQVVFGKGDASAIYIMNADGTNVRVLEKFAWHPDFGKAVDP
jgi:TolB protein